MKKNTKNRILEKGSEIIKLKGFHHTGIQEILNAAGIPKGSFYFYFKNKEEFGLELVEYFSKDFITQADLYLTLEEGTYIDRLHQFFNHYYEKYRSINFVGGCPIGNLAQEMGDINIRFRVKLNDIMNQMKEKIELFLQHAQQDKEISTDINITKMSEFIFNSWQGTLLRSKITKTKEPLQLFDEIVFNTLLK